MFFYQCAFFLFPLPGFTSVILSSIERRYQFSSTQAGLIAVTYDITVTITVIFISYFGGRSHKPRFLGVSLLVIGCGTFVFSSPQFLFGRYDVGSSNQTVFESCNNDSSHPPVDGDCSAANIAAYVMFILGNILVGIGASPLYTVGQAYLDEIVHPSKVSLYIGSFHVCAVVGPALGYGVGSGLLSVYVDPWEPTSLDESDPSWVGAWWLPFVLMGVCCFLLSIPFFLFPRYLVNSKSIKKERAKEMAKVYDDEYVYDNSLTLMVKTFPVHIKRLLGNASFMLVSFGSAVAIIVSSGMVSFAPKYVETQFGISSSSAGLTVGAVGIFGAGQCAFVRQTCMQRSVLTCQLCACVLDSEWASWWEGSFSYCCYPLMDNFLLRCCWPQTSIGQFCKVAP